jgi:D-glycero-alpha-D-manno-heptose 1-phosphate guanylyltransferase
MNAIILCGGLSTRLGDITKSIPKVLLEIGGKTVLDWQLEKLSAVGVTTVVLAAGHLSDVLLQTVGQERNGMKLVYAIEPERLGTGGAIKFAYTYLEYPEDPTIILNGDVLFTMSLHEMVSQLKPSSDGSILGVYVDDIATYGALSIGEDNHLDAFKEKEGKHIGGYINGSVYLFTKKATQYFLEQSAFSVEYDVFPRMTDLYVYTSDAPWIDIGVPDRLVWAREHYQEFT